MRAEMGPRLLILGHHYQQDEVIALSDLRGDSYQLSQMAADSSDCRAIAFCGVHFMAETADILANRPEKLAERGGERVTVVLPDMAAGCSMADMAAIDQVEAAWEELGEVIDTADITPVTYINSAASLKAFCGRHGGIVCTSSNAAAVLDWAFERTKPRAVLSRSAPGPQHGQGDGHSARRNAGLGSARRRARRQHAQSDCATARCCCGRATAACTRCSGRSTCEHVPRQVSGHQDSGASRMPDGSGRQGRRVAARRARSSATVEAAPPGTKWAIGTELHLVNRLKQEHPEQEIHFLSPVVCMCATMYRIDLAHLCWSLENLAAGTPVNVIEVDDETARWSLVALERMLEVK